MIGEEFPTRRILVWDSFAGKILKHWISPCVNQSKYHFFGPDYFFKKSPWPLLMFIHLFRPFRRVYDFFRLSWCKKAQIPHCVAMLSLLFTCDICANIRIPNLEPVILARWRFPGDFSEISDFQISRVVFKKIPKSQT